MYHNTEELKDLIAAKLSVEQIIDILCFDIYDVIDKLEDEIIEMQEEFEEAIK